MLNKVENIVAEIAYHEQFLLWPQCFQKSCAAFASKWVCRWERDKHVAKDEYKNRVSQTRIPCHICTPYLLSVTTPQCEIPGIRLSYQNYWVVYNRIWLAYRLINLDTLRTIRIITWQDLGKQQQSPVVTNIVRINNNDKLIVSHI